ncbi:unnamed protein product, partial [Iphiclides podalirius]
MELKYFTGGLGTHIDNATQTGNIVNDPEDNYNDYVKHSNNKNNDDGSNNNYTNRHYTNNNYNHDSKNYDYNINNNYDYDSNNNHDPNNNNNHNHYDNTFHYNNRKNNETSKDDH